MASNFNQKELLETNNTKREAKGSLGGRLFLYIILTLPLFLGWIWYVGKRNWFQITKERVVENLANIDAKLTERYNVLTNQLKVASAALAHEKELQETVANVRAAVTQPQPYDANAVAAKDQTVRGLISRWNMVQENYPEIKAMPVMQDLNKTVYAIEDDLQAQRRFYSAIAREFNAALYTYPSNVIAVGMGLARFPMFEAEDAQRANVSLDFNK